MSSTGLSNEPTGIVDTPGPSRNGDQCAEEAREKADRGGGPRQSERKSRAAWIEVVLWRAFDCFETNRKRVRYDRFRKAGLPLTSSHVESGLKQTNARAKGSEKAWLLVHAEEMLALRCQALSAGGRWDGYFDRLRQGEIEIPTRGRMRPLPVLQPESLPLARPAA